jgi:hypothetical protein
MRIVLKVLAAFAAAVLAGQSLAAAAPEAPVEIVAAEFGTFDASDAKRIVFVPTSVVPHRTGQRYGWVIEVRTSRRSLSVREEYVLANPVPAKKPDNPIAENLAVPLERHNQVSQRQLVPVDGKIYGEWEIGPNEPAGHRLLQVVVEGVAAARFDYDVQ